LLDTRSYTPSPLIQSSVLIVKPVSYQFQVVEYVKDYKIVKVELQAQVTTHDELGNVIMSSGFKPVPRVQLPYNDFT
jgi:hypothetical protein